MPMLYIFIKHLLYSLKVTFIISTFRGVMYALTHKHGRPMFMLRRRPYRTSTKRGFGQIRKPVDREGVKDLENIHKIVLYYYSSMFCGCSLWVMPKYKL